MMRSLVTAGMLATAAADFDPGMVCSGCALLSSLAQEGADVPWAQLTQGCGDDKLCQVTVSKMSQFANKATDMESPDTICQSLGYCDGTCALYNDTYGPAWPPEEFPPAPPAWPVQSVDPATEGETKHLIKIFAELGGYVAVKPLQGDIECNRTDIYCDVMRFADYHYPLVDKDGDEFNDFGEGTLRGYHWRGKDCDTTDGQIYPGRKATTYGDDVDHDCNGISGTAEDGVSFEDKYCSGTERRGLVILGDSATAHFHIPPAWLTADGWDRSIVVSEQSRLLLEDEADVPYCSWGSGHVDADQCPYAFGQNITSIYLKLRERNRCNHRDYQNIGVNGARISTSMPLVESMARDPTNDNPLLVIFSLMGNDVCNGHPGSDHMTTPEDFYQHALESLNALDGKVPKGSYVMSVGLVDGRVLWNALSEDQHPIGASYPQFYEFLSCNGVNPCWGWLNADESWRNYTSERAANLTQVWLDIEATETFENFTLINFTPDFQALMDEYVEEFGGEASDLIEPSDGFHPSQLGNIMLAEAMWDYLETTYPEAIGDVNPYNDEIDTIFGDQGGY